MEQARRKVLITGAAGGMGRACARLFGASNDLVLTDIAGPGFERFAEELRSDGYIVSAHPGDIAEDKLLAALAREVGGGLPFTLVHTAGLSPSLADWRKIMLVNLVATEKLLQAIEPDLVSGVTAVLIASVAGHIPLPDMPLFADPLQPDFLERAGEVIDQMGGAQSPAGREGLSYMLSKRAVLGICQRRGPVWAARGARIVTISPGMISTPMGRSEMEKTLGGMHPSDASALGRVGTPMDIALAAQFLASDAASFITGVDLKVDGGGNVI